MCNRVISTQLTLAQILNFGPIIEKPICDDCAAQFDYLKYPICSGCGKQQLSEDLCADCKMWQIKNDYLLHNRSLIAYNDATKQFMQQYKFSGDFRLRRVFTSPLVDLIKQMQPDLVIPIPVNEYTWETRGFNQVSGMLGDITVNPLLQTVNQNRHILQSHKKRQERLLTKQPFKLALHAKEEIKHKNIVLVDDVYTTGRTLYHAANLVRQCSPEKLKSITLAR
ncbi:ComF family protein [Paucilactobacillus hokkaidonensis]|nr:ComF family protein [Paucilactobacillus hokkaidonensis]